MRKSRLQKQSVADELVKRDGNMAAVGRALGVSRSAVYQFIQKHDELQMLVEDCRESFVDEIESALYKQAKGGNVTACIFILKTLGRYRGYSEKLESERITFNPEDCTDEELERIASGEIPTVVLKRKSK